MKKLIIILLLIPCFLKAQVTRATRDVIDSSINANNLKIQKQTDSLFLNGDTTVKITILKSGNINFDTIKITNNTIQGFVYDLKGFASNIFSFAHIVVYVINNNGVYSLVWPPTIPPSQGGSPNIPGTPTNYVAVGMGNSFAITVINNLVIIKYTAAVANKTVMDWILTKIKINA